MLLLLASWRCSWADSIYGVTNNAAQNALSWSMAGVLPDFSAPTVTLQVNGVVYYYVMTKETNDDAKVYVRNLDTVNGGYIFEEVDDWSGLPSNSIQKNFRFTGIPGEQWGQGSITVEGDGTVTDPSVTYSYRMDIAEDSLICINPLSNPSCPGFLDAVYKYLNSITELNADNDLYEYWLELQEEKGIKKESENLVVLEESNDELQTLLMTDPSVGGLIDLKQQNNTFKELSNITLINPYYDVEFDSNEYSDKYEIEDEQLPDNNRALRQLARSAKYYSMVRSQYDREELTGE